MKNTRWLFLLVLWSCTPASKPAPPASSPQIMDHSLLAAVLKNDQWSFINPKGETVLRGPYTYADNFSSGWACVSEGGVRSGGMVLGATYFFVNTKGAVSDFSTAMPTRFQDGRAVATQDNKQVVMDRTGTIIASGFDQITPFQEGLAPAVKGKQIGFLDTEGNWAIELEAPVVIDPFQEGLARAKKNQQIGFLNRQGAWQIPPTLVEAYPFSEGRALAAGESGYGFLDQAGNWVIEAIYQDGVDFSEGLCPVQKEGKWGYIDSLGKTMIAFQYDACRGFHQGLAAVLVDGKGGYINPQGEMMIEPQFEAAFDFQHGLAIAQLNRKMGFINFQGEWVIPPEYTRVNPFVKPAETNPLFRR